MTSYPSTLYKKSKNLLPTITSVFERRRESKRYLIERIIFNCLQLTHTHTHTPIQNIRDTHTVRKVSRVMGIHVHRQWVTVNSGVVTHRKQKRQSIIIIIIMFRHYLSKNDISIKSVWQIVIVICGNNRHFLTCNRICAVHTI